MDVIEDSVVAFLEMMKTIDEWKHDEEKVQTMWSKRCMLGFSLTLQTIHNYSYQDYERLDEFHKIAKTRNRFFFTKSELCLPLVKIYPRFHFYGLGTSSNDIKEILDRSEVEQVLEIETHEPSIANHPAVYRVIIRSLEYLSGVYNPCVTEVHYQGRCEQKDVTEHFPNFTKVTFDWYVCELDVLKSKKIEKIKIGTFKIERADLVALTNHLKTMENLKEIVILRTTHDESDINDLVEALRDGHISIIFRGEMVLKRNKYTSLTSLV